MPDKQNVITNTIVVALHSHVNNPAINANARAISKEYHEFLEEHCYIIVWHDHLHDLCEPVW